MRRLAVLSLLTLSLMLSFRPTLLSAQCPEEDDAQAVDLALESPGELIGCRIHLEGVLESKGTGENTVYTVRTGSGASLDVWSWAPEEEGSSRYPSKLPSDMKPMSYFIGRKLSIVGRLVKEQGGNVVIEVSSVAVLDDGPN